MNTKRPVIRYSEAFKSQVLNEIESGSSTLAQVRRKYQIKGCETIQQWARKSGRFGVIPKLIRVESPKERNESKALKEENKRLKQIIADLVLDQKIAESTLEVICEQQGWDVEEVKKKVGTQLLKKLSPKGKK